MAPDKVKIKKIILSKYQLMVAGFYKTLNGNVKKFVPKYFDKGKYVLYYEHLQFY